MSLIHEGLLVCYRCEGKIEEYYTMDYIFAIGMRESKEIRRIIATVPKINANLFGLEDLMCKSYKKEEYDAFILTAPFFKLNTHIMMTKATIQYTTMYLICSIEIYLWTVSLYW